MNKWFRVALVMLVVAAVGGAAWAGDGKNRFRLCIGSFQPTGDLRVLDPFEVSVDGPSAGGGPHAAIVPMTETFVDPSGSVGYMLGYERSVGRRLGVELGVMYADHDMDITEREGLFDDATGGFLPGFDTEFFNGGMDMSPVTLGLNWHLLDNEKVDLYAGPTIGYVFFGDFKVRVPEGQVNLSVDDDLAYGAVVGVDLPFKNRKFFFSAMARWLETTADVEVPVELTGDRPLTVRMDVDPYSIDAGFGYRF